MSRLSHSPAGEFSARGASAKAPAPGVSGAGLDAELYEQLEESVAVFRKDGTYLFLNAATERLFGKRRDELLGRLFWEVFPDAVNGQLHQAFLQVAETGQRVEFENYYAPWRRWFVNRLMRSGERIFMFSREVTTQKRVEAEHAEYAASTQRLVEETQRAEQRTAFLARSGEVLSSSLDYEEILRRLARLSVPALADWCAVDLPTPEGEVRRLTLEHTQPERIAQGYAFHARYPVTLADVGGIGRVLSTGIPEFVPELSDALIDQMVADPQHRRDIRELGLRSYICVPLNSRGRTLAALTLVYGDSRRRYTEEDLRLAEELARRAGASLDNGQLYTEAQEAIRARDLFLSVASHELNTPLTSLNLSAQALQRALQRAGQGPQFQETAEAKLVGMQRQILRLTRLVHELLDVSRITEGKLRLEPEEVDLALLARELVPRFADDLSRVGSELRLEAPASLVGLWDAVRMEQVLQNLLSNAIKYGEGRPIEVFLTADEKTARVVVQDEGIGISEEGQGRLFRRFERLASERHYSGFGLGLWIIKQIVDAMGGTIQVRSELGKGSTFTVELPRHC